MGERLGLNEKKPEVNRDNSDSRMQRTDHPRSVNPLVDRILFLQRTVGNQAVQRLLRSEALQAKLRIGQPGDVYEQEADRVADEVMRMPEPQVQQQTEPEEVLQAKELTSQTSESTLNIESRINALQARGRHLPESTRSFFEPRFGHDFSQVRVHTNAQAAEMARAMNARAFTTGRDIVFGAGQYAPEATGGKKLLAHELTHVLQQTGGSLQGKLTTNRDTHNRIVHKASIMMVGKNKGNIKDEGSAVCNTVTPSLPSSPSAPASSPAAEEIRRTRHKQKNRVLINNTQGILADLKKNLVIQRRILIGRRPEITEEERETIHELYVQERYDLVHESTPVIRPPYYSNTPQNIIRGNRALALRIVDDMEESGEDLYFRDLDELRREVATRIETSTAMQATQEGPERRAFAYPRRGDDNYYGPRVNIAARAYWEPSVPDNYRVRRPAQAMNPSDPDLAQGAPYNFTLTNPGRLNGYQALMSLFEPQSHVRHRTLIHCDRLANLIHFRSFAVLLGSGEFNRRVEGGIIPLVLRHDGYFGISYSDVSRTGGPRTRVHLRFVNPVNRGDFLIGDHVVFHNHRYYDLLMEIAGSTGVWRLEHAILIDRQGSDPVRDDIFLGHGSGRRNEQGIKQVLRTHFNNMVGPARRMLLADYSRLERRFSGHLTRLGREFYFDRWRIHEITENEVPGLYDPRTYPGGSFFRVYRPAESRRDN